MKKIIFSFLSVTIIAFCYSPHLKSQSSEKDLNQEELTKQFIGTWVTDWDEGTISTWDIKPLENGYEFNILWKSEGKPYRTDKGIIGFSSDGVVTMAYVWATMGGILTCHYGNFESKTKMISKAYDSRQGQVVTIYEYEFLSPEKMKMVVKMKEADETWDQAEASEFVFIKE